ncbi:hypothetical protein LTR62_003316 [Meristemomyces frigidus]|uniref:Pentatricopeptide repeat-containing protein-mitochondrial domain-containing protein n=1 Tax=Meristemomyces frigidus TaxID=1508187 RepID=A0AAN7YRW4_9PEZI|nr:hypothetical protein LTR62_003316 [Meristemomyces frigidus]
MSTAKVVIDPLWQCLCPSWAPKSTGRFIESLVTRSRPEIHCRYERRPALVQRRTYSGQAAVYTPLSGTDGRDCGIAHERRRIPKGAERVPRREHARISHDKALEEWVILAKQPTPYLYTKLRTLALNGKTRQTRELVEFIIRERKEKPTLQLYNALILSNISHDDGAAWRVTEYLDEMRQAGLQMDTGTCHAILKVLAVHPDHLLRMDVLEYMRARWLQLSDDAAHDIAAGLLREGSFEAALRRIDEMQGGGVEVRSWLLDMAVYMLSAAGEIGEAYRIMRQRHDAVELNLSRTLWYTLLDASSSHRHHASTAMIWNSQVITGYIRPASGVCSNVLITAAQAGDAVLATDVFSHLSKRGTAFTASHYQLLTDCYLTSNPPDINRALTILTIMALEKIPEPSPAETRSLFLHLRGKPVLTAQAFRSLREMDTSGKKVPIAALNLVIECYVHQRDLPSALNVYKQIHTFRPVAAGAAESTSKHKSGSKARGPYANIETFNLLLRGCRVANPPDESLASFLVSELLALRVKPTALTYDRLILVFVQAGIHALTASAPATQEPDITSATQRKRGRELLDWAFRHLVDMQAVSSTTAPTLDSASDFGHDKAGSSLGWMPRFGTIERLATALATARDERCWDVLQMGEDHKDVVEGWGPKGGWVRRNVEQAWEKAMIVDAVGKVDEAQGTGGTEAR